MRHRLDARSAAIFDCPVCHQEVILRGLTPEQVSQKKQIGCPICKSTFHVGEPETAMSAAKDATVALNEQNPQTVPQQALDAEVAEKKAEAVEAAVEKLQPGDVPEEGIRVLSPEAGQTAEQ